MSHDGFHERLRTVVGDRSFRHLSELTGTHHETVRRYMQGQAPSVEFLTELCRALGVNANWLLTGVGPPRMAELSGEALRQAPTTELLKAMGHTIESLLERVERLEVFLQTMEVRLRAAVSEDAISSQTSSGRGSQPSEAKDDHGAGPQTSADPPPARAKRIARALAEREPPASD